MAGDRLEPDIRMGRRAGIATALVLSGISTWEMAEAAPPEERPHYLLETLAGLV
jgi:ribonucleotide monophosphatase NagD (HAD superfamily)